jgi:hypothetical protein
MKTVYFRIKKYLQKIYRITLGNKHFDKFIWKDLKKMHREAGWRSGVYENERYIESVFEISDNIYARYHYMLYENYFRCHVKVLEEFPEEITTDLFVMSTHFNNHLNSGVVLVNVESNCVEYRLKTDYASLIINTELNYYLLNLHYNISKDVYWAFHKLIKENEEPAIIIADLLTMVEARKSNS